MNPVWIRRLMITAAVIAVPSVLLVPDHRLVGVVILAAISIESGIFVGLYAWRSNWRATSAGRIIMRLMLCLAAIGAHGTVNALTDAGYPGREFIRPLLLLGVALAVLHLVLRLSWVQRDRGEDER
ncbi:hypothetical protein GV794_01860 [Nocardia cyriacigeorgica]|uniref:Uncharacterized protein n=1 Tax=Nocardia cyriacigeorgica TaxID=135487 RepID=A0ABX0CCX4_9NOCA|nr:hypothetical protein [Nocardia cyriacigeorgica]NEW40770.1 hypothetical protein [Nocardia cyriacigeorgica]NEW51003.1 hypothetical protein [Nocardia cyriacigeorgica]NEW54413.1 hypothetical protein [Nocardia cyriacigeorgica]